MEGSLVTAGEVFGGTFGSAPVVALEGILGEILEVVLEVVLGMVLGLQSLDA